MYLYVRAKFYIGKNRISEHKRDLMHNKLSNALVMHTNKFEHKFDLANATLTKYKSNFLRRKFLEDAALESYQNIDLHPDHYPSIFFDGPYVLVSLEIWLGFKSL